MERTIMTLNKKKLAAAIGGTLLAGVGVQTTQAAVDLDDTASIGLKYASEIVIGTAGVGLTHANLQDINGIMAVNGVQSTTDIRVTLTLSSGTFTAPPALKIVQAGLTDTGCKTAAATADLNPCPATTLFTGGTTADSSVTFNTATGTGTINAGAHFSFEMAGVTVPNQSAVTATVTTQIADSFGPTDLPTKSGPYISFNPLLSLVADATTATPQAIDVAQNSLFFANVAATGDNAINVGGVRVVEDVSATAGVGVATVAIDATDVISGAGHTITAANGFSAFDQGTAVTGESIKVNGVAAVVSTADSTLAVAATAAVPAGGNVASSQDVILTAPAANTVEIAETTLTSTVTSITAGAVYSAATSTGTVALGGLARNGSTARLTFSVNPDSAYPMSIRVTNDSAIVGPTTLTLTNDDGVTSSAINITSISGGPASDLAAGASTGLLSIADVYAAVQAADATFALGASSNKLRVAISSLTPSVVLNAFSLSSDGTTFSMVTDAGA